MAFLLADGSVRWAGSRPVAWCRSASDGLVDVPATVALRLVESCEDDDERSHHDGRYEEDEDRRGRRLLARGRGARLLRESLSWVCQQLMEAEVSALVGAVRGERAPEERLTQRNG